MSSQYTLFLDLDGVLVDFDNGVKRVTGKYPSELPPQAMWPRLSKTDGFYAELGWMLDGRNLWDFCKPFSPHILTGLPMGKWAEPQKRLWCERELGANVHVITCLSKNKHIAAAEFVAPGTKPVLVDDRVKLQEAWEEAGGIFILHTSATDSISQLQKLGF